MKKLLILVLFISSCLPSCQTRKNTLEVTPKNALINGRQVDVVASGLEVPWAMAFAPDGRLFVTERPGRIRVIEKGVLKKEPLRTLTDVFVGGEAGLMGLALHPNFAEKPWVYVCYTYKDQDGIKEKIKRFREENSTLLEDKVILDDIPAARFHVGCRLKFGPDGKLYITTGDATNGELAQKLDSLAGKTLRLNDDGSVPKDNPFVGNPHSRPEIWSYGHRNAQGIAWQPGSRLMFQTEHGPSMFDGPAGGDEINIVMKGKNYGWPLAHHQETKTGLESPWLEYTPAIAPGGATFYTGSKIPEWQNDFFVACLKGARVIRIHLVDTKVVETQDLMKDTFGRIRDIAEGPDGALYFATSNTDGRGSANANDDKIMRIR